MPRLGHLQQTNRVLMLFFRGGGDLSKKMNTYPPENRDPIFKKEIDTWNTSHQTRGEN